MEKTGFDVVVDRCCDLSNLCIDMVAYITKMATLHQDAGMSEANLMFLERYREIYGLKRLDGIDVSSEIAGDR